MKKYAFISIVLLSCAAASSANVKRAQNAITVEEYRERLIECKQQGKDAGSLAVYERCARDADIKYGLDQTNDGGAHD